jgi:hypothetical protein
VVFIAGLAGRHGQPPTAREVDASLQAMVDGVRRGEFRGWLTLNPQGEPLQFA